MRRVMERIAMMARGGMLLSLMVLGGLAPAYAHTQVSVNVNIGPPAPVVVEAPPPMLFLPEPGVYVAVGIPYDMYFIGGRYYYFHHNHWFWGTGYTGPWTYVEYRGLPPGLRRYEVVRLRQYRDREYRVYQVQGRNFNGKHFYAVADDHDRGHHDRDGDDDDDRGHGHGNGNGNGGRGKGKKH